MGQHAAKDYLESLTPGQLGLEGESMEDYEVMIVDGIVLVNDLAHSSLAGQHTPFRLTGTPEDMRLLPA